ncbi:MAG: EAL domain-containing protein [Gammaproteobacteria bacterium]|nr:EAL domain-containing protein [Gammaproteobacteria bacterium]
MSDSEVMEIAKNTAAAMPRDLKDTACRGTQSLRFLIGRQPIYDRDMGVFGYELLYRPTDGRSIHSIDGSVATSQVLLNSFLEIGLHNLVGSQLAFVNLTRDLIVSDDLLMFSPQQIALEVLEDTEVDREVLHALHTLSRQGYVIALDDFTYEDRLKPLVESADIVKLDIRALEQDNLERHVTLLSGFPVKLVAEKVETHDEFEHCKALGFDYFQGYFLSRPATLESKRPPTNRLSVMRLLLKLHDPEVGMGELEMLITSDVTLSYKVLRAVNIASSYRGKVVDSIHQALILLGMDTIKRLATLIVLSGIDDKPKELVTMALIRAKVCELAANQLHVGTKEVAFTVGLLSVFDAMLDTPMDSILPELPVSGDVKQALLGGEGVYGPILESAVAYERGEWSDVEQNGAIGSENFVSALTWATEASQLLTTISRAA